MTLISRFGEFPSREKATAAPRRAVRRRRAGALANAWLAGWRGLGLGAPDEDEGAVVGAAYFSLHGGDQGGGAGFEADGHHALGLAEQAVGADVDVAAG